MPTRPKRIKKRKISLKGFIVITTIVVIVVAAVYFVLLRQNFVSAQQFQNYAQAFIGYYNQSLDFFLPETFSSFDFYSNQSYNVTAFLSSTYGAAIIFDPSENWSFAIINATQRVEDAIFGQNNSLQLTKFTFQGEKSGFIAGRNANISIGKIGIFADVGSNVLFKNIRINSVLYNCLFIKGSNYSRYWDNNAAMKDSKRIFDADLYYALNRSEEVRMRYYEPELTALLLEILAKWDQSIQSNGEVTYTYTQKEHDIQQVEELAKNQYGITNSSEFVSNILDYLRYASLPPPKIVFGINDPENWVYTMMCGIQPSFSYGFYFLLKWIYKKHPSEDLKYFLAGIMTVIIAQGGYSFVVNYPYDFRFLSIQTLLIAIMWIVGVISVYKTRKMLGDYFATKQQYTRESKETD